MGPPSFQAASASGHESSGKKKRHPKSGGAEVTFLEMTFLNSFKKPPQKSNLWDVNTVLGKQEWISP